MIKTYYKDANFLINKIKYVKIKITKHNPDPTACKD